MRGKCDTKIPVPGEHLVIDWAKENGRNIFCAVLAWSRYRFVRFGSDQTRETTLKVLVECFEELGGVPGVVLTDRMGVNMRMMDPQIVNSIRVRHFDGADTWKFLD